MATQNDYSFQENGVVIIGATTLNNVTNVTTSYSQDVPTSQRVSAGDTVAKTVEGMPQQGELTITIELYDEEGIDADLNSFQVGASSGKNQTIKVRPLGTGSGLKELVAAGMRLMSKDRDHPTGDDFPASSGSLEWRGYFDEEPLETDQS